MSAGRAGSPEVRCLADLDSANALVEGFTRFNDAVIHRIEYQLDEAKRGNHTMSITIEARSNDEFLDAGWYNLGMRFFGVSEFDVCGMQVISNDASAMTCLNGFAIEFGYLVNPPRSLNELRESRFFVCFSHAEMRIEHIG